MYELCIVGAGLVGSAAARHASLLTNARMCLIGPTEPQVRSLASDREIFGAHYDEGRITRSSDRDPVWATLAQRSIDRYRNLEIVSGIPFYFEVGCLTVGPATEPFVSNTKDTALRQGLQHVYLNSKSLKAKFPYLNFSDTDEAIYETTRSGYINPRKLIEAQQTVAKSNGCDVIDDVVEKVRRECCDGVFHMVVTTGSGRRINARNVLLATGAFTTFREVLDPVPDVTLCPLTVALVEVSEEDAIRIRSMPTLAYYGNGAPDWWKDFPRNSNDLIGFYALPPIKYPDGKYYIKLGNFADSVPSRLSTAQQVKDWYCKTGHSDLVTNTARLVQTLATGIQMKSFHGDHCVIVETPTTRPYIDLVHPNLGLAIGGNGFAAKSSDEIGRLAAMLVLNRKWDSEHPAECFKLRLKPHEQKQSKL